MAVQAWVAVLTLSLFAAQFFTTYLIFNSKANLNEQIQHLQSVVDDLQNEVRKQGGGSPPLRTDSSLLQANPGTLVPAYLSLVSPPNIITKEQGQAVAKVDEQRHVYGGKGDPEHLGGFTNDDREGQSPALWTWMMKYLIVQSVVDVGCGRGISTKWFKDHGARVLCVEGSSDAVSQSLLDKKLIVQHDFSRGPWWPKETFDVAWAVEFVEHVGRQYMKNYYPIFKRAALIFVTHSYWGGWHHVEVHGDYWWKARMEMQGFVYSHDLTVFAHAMARISSSTHSGQHLASSLQVFINPEVASLPQHAHLMGVDGCFGVSPCGFRGVCACKGIDTLPKQFEPIFQKPSEYDEAIKQTEAEFSGLLKSKLPS